MIDTDKVADYVTKAEVEKKELYDAPDHNYN